MPSVFIADPLLAERSALKLVVRDLNMQIAGEASDWSALLSQKDSAFLDMILLSWDILPKNYNRSIKLLRKKFPQARIVAIIDQTKKLQHFLNSTKVDSFISKEEYPLSVVEILENSLRSQQSSQRVNH